MRWMFAAEERGEIPKGTAKRWAEHTKNIKKLPERKRKGTKKKGAVYERAKQDFEFYCKVASAFILPYLSSRSSFLHPTSAGQPVLKNETHNNQHTVEVPQDPLASLKNYLNTKLPNFNKSLNQFAANSLNAFKRKAGPKKDVT